MAQNKKTRASKYNDKAFMYDPVGNYELSDFKNLSLLKIHGIAAILNIRNVKKNKREQLNTTCFNETSRKTKSCTL